MAHKRALNEIQLMLDGMDLGKQFISDLRKNVKLSGGDDVMTYNAIKSDSGLLKEFAKRIVETATNGAKHLALKSLKLIADGIAVATEPFTKGSFFDKADGPVKLWFGDNFKKWILQAIPDTIPAFQGKLLKTQLTEYMYDSAILNELGQPKPLAVPEFAAIIRELLTKQPTGEDGTLLNDGYANIFYVVLEDTRVVAVSVLWDSDSREWCCLAEGLGVDGWGGGRCVFSRS